MPFNFLWSFNGLRTARARDIYLPQLYFPEGTHQETPNLPFLAPPLSFLSWSFLFLRTKKSESPLSATRRRVWPAHHQHILFLLLFLGREGGRSPLFPCSPRWMPLPNSIAKGRTTTTRRAGPRGVHARIPICLSLSLAAFCHLHYSNAALPIENKETLQQDGICSPWPFAYYYRLALWNNCRMAE